MVQKSTNNTSEHQALAPKYLAGYILTLLSLITGIYAILNLQYLDCAIIWLTGEIYFLFLVYKIHAVLRDKTQGLYAISPLRAFITSLFTLLLPLPICLGLPWAISICKSMAFWDVVCCLYMLSLVASLVPNVLWTTHWVNRVSIYIQNKSKINVFENILALLAIGCNFLFYIPWLKQTMYLDWPVLGMTNSSSEFIPAPYAIVHPELWLAQNCLIIVPVLIATLYLSYRVDTNIAREKHAKKQISKIETNTVLSTGDESEPIKVKIESKEQIS
jgi:hypothetical protein